MPSEVKEGKIDVEHVDIRQSIFFLLFKLIGMEFVAGIVIVIVFSPIELPFLPLDIKLKFIAYNISFFLILVAIKIFFTLYIVLDWLNEYYQVTSNEIIHKKGIIWRREDRYPFSRIESIKLSQGILGRLFNYGTLELFEYRLLKYTTLYLIHNPIRYLNIFRNLIPQATEEKEMIRENLIRDQKED